MVGRTLILHFSTSTELSFASSDVDFTSFPVLFNIRIFPYDSSYETKHRLQPLAFFMHIPSRWDDESYHTSSGDSISRTNFDKRLTHAKQVK